jgi:hypothetical protein
MCIRKTGKETPIKYFGSWKASEPAKKDLTDPLELTQQ